MSEDVTWQSCTPPSAADQDMGRTMIGPVFRSDAAKQKQRRQPCCGFCRNHDLEVPVINHHCDYAKCTCALCELTRRRRLVMCHQQRLWRYKKNNARQKDGEEHSSEDEVSPTASFPQEEQLDLLDPALNRPRRKMVCDKCRNHNLVAKKRGHKGSCPFEDCTCDLCNFTIKRQQLMKHQQRVRRNISKSKRGRGIEAA